MDELCDGTPKIQLLINAFRMFTTNAFLYEKSCEIGIVLIGSEESHSTIEEKVEYPHICEMAAIAKPEFRLVNEINSLKTTTYNGDIISSLKLTTELIKNHCGDKKYQRRIFLITDSKTIIDETELTDLIPVFTKNNIKLNCILCDDQESASTIASLNNSKILNEFASKIEGKIFNIKKANEIFSRLTVKNVKSVAKYRGILSIDQSTQLQIVTYTRCSEQKYMTLKKYSLITEFNEKDDENKVALDRSTVLLEDTDQKPLAKEDIVKGYMFGKNLIPVSEIDSQAFKEPQPREMKLLGFTKSENIRREHFMSGVDIVFPSEESSKKAFYALVHSTLEEKKVMICSFVNRGNAINLVALIPQISERYSCFNLVTLPTIEDIRDFAMPDLKESTTMQNIATKNLIKALSLVKEGEEELKPKMLFNPQTAHRDQCLIHRALNGENADFPELCSGITNSLIPNKELYENASNEIKAFEGAFNLIKVNQEEEVKKKRLYWSDIISKTNESEAVKAKPKQEPEEPILKISSIDPVNDFKKMISDRNADRVTEAINQIKEIILQFVKESLKGDEYNLAFDCLVELRKGCLSEDEPTEFNDFLLNIKSTFLTGMYSDFFAELVKRGINLITSDENKNSSLNKEAQIEFIKTDTLKQNEPTKAAENLLDDIE